MKKPATNTDKNLAKLLPEHKSVCENGNCNAASDADTINPGQEVSVHPLHADLIWLGRCPLIDSHK